MVWKLWQRSDTAGPEATATLRLALSSELPLSLALFQKKHHPHSSILCLPKPPYLDTQRGSEKVCSPARRLRRETIATSS